jgi:hypothetical protein
MVSQNIWKYATFGLMAVLAIGFTFPQASAHITNSLSHNVAHILEAIGGVGTGVGEVNTAVGEVGDAVADVQEALNTGDYSQIQVITVSNEEEIFQGQAFDETFLSFTVPHGLEGKLLACQFNSSTEPDSGFLFISIDIELNDDDAFTCSNNMDVTLNPGDRISVTVNPPDPAIGTDIVIKMELTAWMQLRPAD